MCLVFRVWYFVKHFARYIKTLCHQTLNTKHQTTNTKHQIQNTLLQLLTPDTRHLKPAGNS